MTGPNQSDGESSDSGQTVLVGNDGGFGLPDAQTFERDDGTEGIVPPDEVFLPPLRTAANGWQKYHAKHDCGEPSVYYVENKTSPSRTTDRFDWKLLCSRCDRHVRWQDVLYISDEWFHDRQDAIGYRLFDNLRLSPDQVLDLGPEPTEAELLEAISAAFDERDEMLQEHRDWMKQEFGDSDE